MQKKNHDMFQKPMKVLVTSTILTTTLFTPIMTSGLAVHAETVAGQSVNQYEQREFELPGAGDFWKEAERERRSAQKSFMPTGIYVKPNEQVTIEVSGTKKIRAIIGTHQYDKEWGKEFDLSPGSNTISSPNGGLLGFDNPQDTGTVKVKVTQGGSPVPFFELGKHTKKDWIAMMDKYPNAPAVQLKSEKAALTVTRDSAKKYIVNQDPVPLLERYDEMIRAQDKISGLSETDPNPLHRTKRRLWTFVENPHNNTSGGYMYASLDGAVFPTDNGAIVSALDVNKFGWGQMHEAGHARQQYPWTWNNDLRGMTEVTVNLYSLAAQKQLFPNQPTRLEKEGDYDKAFKYLKQTDKDYKNIDDLFVKLVMIWQLQLAYGDDFYPNLHKLYRELPKDQLPKTDEEKIQAYIYNTSKVAKQNLLPFFDQWGLKASEETRKKIEALNYSVLTAPIWEATDSKLVKPNVGEPTITKQVSDQDEKGKTGVALQNKYEDFTYDVKVSLPAEVVGYNALRIYDDIEAGINIEKVTVEDDKGTDISSYGEMKVDKTTGVVEFNFAKDKIKDVAGKSVSMKVTGKLKEDADLSNYGERIIPNTAKVQWNGEEKESNQATVKVPFLKLGDRVWEDHNRNGIQDQGEKGIEGVRVQLLNKDGNVLKEVKTDKEGNYLFEGLTETTYRVQVVAPSGYVFTSKQGGQDVMADSNVSENGVTDYITLLNDDLTIDAGINSKNETSNTESNNNESSNTESGNKEQSNNESSNTELGNKEQSNNEASNMEQNNNESSNKSSDTNNKSKSEQTMNKKAVLPSTGSQTSILSLVGAMLLVVSAIFRRKSTGK
ncbi:TPA: isopeptide-forming domain-containing fimbrial protein [Bacillus pseudomycoides]|nr:isopeptide-forming domain-containing fimbrial protein [Bacillus pseudomycoides]